MNSVNLIGNLTKDVELETTNNDVAYVRFTLAVQKNFKNEEGQYESDFIKCIAWRGTAEFISKYFKKGNKLAISGAIQTRKYVDSSGNDRFVTEVLAEKAEFVQKREGSAEPTPPPECKPIPDDDTLPF